MNPNLIHPAFRKQARGSSRKRRRQRRQVWAMKSVNGKISCHWCRHPLDRNAFTLDHVFGLAEGGRDRLRNIVPACYPCNAHRGRQQERCLAELELTWFIRFELPLLVQFETHKEAA